MDHPPIPPIVSPLPIILAGLAVLLLATFRGAGSIQDFFTLQTSQAVLERTVQGLRQETAELEQEIARIKNSRSYARKVLRDKYHLTEDDEEIMFFTD